ncbi:hypothetical protein CC1G_12928 [Coprinopsis cinerea okayama7|uniref:Uncharacterized protein n=1 Tax=Coprinopsis cinerea (strain Okayama-7 / 130 / ATCC MYA-4618 / FGSC 9003) TaxID=240176 RepID=A8N9N3_COPC7|nr:hypothetical protein CC1G_12928 [Coprinopsis cinerea okayama7\|eukprot:XP_001831539.2 hypothetical protein CC1G_12928 [Coprinopsis cinerea okayama7\
MPQPTSRAQKWSGTMVGLLPIVKEDADKSGKKMFVDFKCVVWHTAFGVLLKLLKEYAPTGVSILCGDDIVRLLILIILILSADHEEQCVMAAVRGFCSSFPCPVCLVPQDWQYMMTKRYSLQTVEEMHAEFLAASAGNHQSREDNLKAIGLQGNDNVRMYSGTSSTQIFMLALSFDRLHAYNGGLFSDHLLEEFLKILDRSEHKHGALFEKQYIYSVLLIIPPKINIELAHSRLANFPCWCDLNHFNKVARFREFTDGRKYEDLSRVIIFASQNILPVADSKCGYQLLRLMHSFWNSTWHGITRNMITKFSEAMHHWLKEYYGRINFKNVDGQISQLHAWSLVALLIREAIARDKAARLDEEEAKKAEEELGEDVTAVGHVTLEGPEVQHIIAGSSIKNITLSDVVMHIPKDYTSTFNDLRKKISTRLATELGRPVNLHGDHKVTLYWYIKVNYTSFEDSTVTTDFLRMNKEYHGQEQYDNTLLSIYNSGLVFVQLLGVIGVALDGIEHLVALAIPYDQPLTGTDPSIRHQDHDLRLHQFRKRKRSDSVVVLASTIVRGALLVEDHLEEIGDKLPAH